MAAGAFTFYNSFKEDIGDGTMDLDTHTFNVALLTNAYTPAATHSVWTDVSANEVAATGGYTAKGQALTSVTWTQTGGTATFDAANVTWSASTITARYAVIFDETAVTDELVGYFELEVGSDVSSTNADFTIQWNASGIFTLA